MDQKLKELLIQEFNSPNIKDMPLVENLNEGPGSFVNLDFKTLSGKRIKLW